MATNNENKTEREIYLNEVAGHVSTFMNELEDGNAHVVERTVAQMKKRFALDDAQEAALQITLFHLEMMHGGMDEDFPMENFVGLECNVICDILLKDYRTICDYRLTDEGIGAGSDEDEEEEMSAEEMAAMRAYGEMLLDWYGTQFGEEDVDKTDTATVLHRFNLDEDNKKALSVLNRFKREMERYRKRGIRNEKIADLIDNTIFNLLDLSE